ncbi:MAG TPA: hypothetical protein ENK07_10740 [Bacteroidetes bacterium]|nr:hypothetical protein [Bacteroidota bacterium]
MDSHMKGGRTDQAEALRRLVARRTPNVELRTEVERLTPAGFRIVITSGKGGVGKSVTSSNLAVCFGEMGLRTLLVDADLMFPNLDLYFGLRPRFTLVEAVQTRSPLNEACLQVGENLWLLPSRAVEAQYMGLESDLLRRLRRFLDSNTRFDMLIVDTASGLNGRVRDLASGADEVWVVTTPGSAAVADTYAMAKYLLLTDPDVPLRLLLNGVKNGREAEDLHRRFSEVTRHFLRQDIPLAGWIPSDKKMEAALEMEVPVCVGFPKAASSKAYRELAKHTADRLMAQAVRVVSVSQASAG